MPSSGWPLVNIYNKRKAAEQSSELAYAGPVPAAPLNRIVMLPTMWRPRSASSRARTRMWSTAAVRSGSEQTPVVVQVPDFGDRFWVYQAVDLRTDSFVELGVTYGTTPGFYLLGRARLARNGARRHNPCVPVIDEQRLYRAAHLHGRYRGGSRIGAAPGKPIAGKVNRNIGMLCSEQRQEPMKRVKALRPGRRQKHWNACVGPAPRTADLDAVNGLRRNLADVRKFVIAHGFTSAHCGDVNIGLPLAVAARRNLFLHHIPMLGDLAILNADKCPPLPWAWVPR